MENTDFFLPLLIVLILDLKTVLVFTLCSLQSLRDCVKITVASSYRKSYILDNKLEFLGIKIAES